MVLTSEKLVAFELCPRRFQWTTDYAAFRISPIRALYMALDSGLTTEKDPERVAENALMAVASSPGLDVMGQDVYSIAMHYAKLAGILAAALRSTSTAPWKPFPDATVGACVWKSACYDMGDGKPRRIALVDRWSDDRKQEESYGWRSFGEAVALDQSVLLTAVTIGSTRDRRRHSGWTRCHQHPRNKTIRFQRKNSSEDFGATWQSIWREDSGINTADWLTQMKKDGCMDDLVHTMQIPVPSRRDDYLAEIARIGEAMGQVERTPPMRLAGCFGFSPCPFVKVCHGTKPPFPEHYGFRILNEPT